jgi:hypothetical protein
VRWGALGVGHLGAGSDEAHLGFHKLFGSSFLDYSVLQSMLCSAVLEFCLHGRSLTSGTLGNIFVVLISASPTPAFSVISLLVQFRVGHFFGCAAPWDSLGLQEVVSCMCSFVCGLPPFATTLG